MSRSTQTIANFCEKIEDVDPDLRQMALFDLQEQLNKADFTLTEPDQDRIVPKIMTAFTAREVNSEVHSQSVRMLTTLVPKLAAKQRNKMAEQLVNTMCGQLTETKAEVIRTLRENAGMGLKAMIEGLSEDNKDTVQGMVPSLLAGLRSSETKIKTDVFDVLADIMKKFGKATAEKHAEIQEGAINNMAGDLGLRKKAVACLAQICLHSDMALFEQVLQLTLDGLQKDRGDKLRRHIQLCNTISRVAADRFGASVEKVIPFFFKELERLRNADSDEAESTQADEVRENILQALDSFVSRCPNNTTTLLPQIVDECGDLLKWDPNYCVDDDEEEDEEFDDDMEEEMDDDDDQSWKVRKSAARCLVSVVRSRPDQLKMVYSKVCDASAPLLPGRFKERVENVRLEILEIFKALLDASKITHNNDGPSAFAGGSGSFQLSSMLGGSFRTIFEARPEAANLVPIKDKLIKSLMYAAKHKSPKVKLAVFTVLRDMFALIGAELGPELPQCAALTITTLKDPRCALPQLRPDVLQFTRVLVNTGVLLVNKTEDENVIKALESLFAPVFATAEDRYFKTVVASLRVCLEFVAAVRVSQNPGKLAQDLFKCVFERLRTGDADQDVKKAAVEAMAIMLKSLEGPLSKTVAGDLEKTYAQFLVLLRNETTRLSVTKSILVINSCKIPAEVLKDFAAELSTFLRKSDRQIREAALRTLGAFVPKHHAVVDPKTLSGIIDELTTESGALLNDKELYLTSLGLQLLRSVAAVPSQAAAVTKSVVPRVLNLLSSPLIQGACVTDAANLFRSLAGRSDLPQQQILGAVITACKGADASNIGNLSVVLGAACAAEPADSKNKVVSEFCSLAKQNGKELVGLACLGELGRSCDCGAASGPVIRGYSKSTSEEVKGAASSALGKTASSAHGKPILDEIMGTIRKDKAERYFLLRALKECVSAIAQDPAAERHSLQADDQKSNLLGLLLEFAPSTEDGVSEIVAECLGRLAQVDSKVVATIASSLNGAAEDVTACLITAMRYAGVTKQNLDSDFAKNLPSFLQHLNAGAPLKVRRAAIQLFGQVAYGTPELLLNEQLKTAYLPGLLNELTVNKALIQEVDLGPFKHIVDNGLELRKLAYECVVTLVENIGRNNSILDYAGDYSGLITKLAAGIGAPEADLDILSSARGMLIKLSRTPAGQSGIIANIDQISDFVKKTIQTGPKDGQDKEKVVDGQRHAIVTALKLESVPGALLTEKFKALMDAARKSGHFQVAARLAGQE